MFTYEFARSLLFWIRGKIAFDKTHIDLELTHCFFVFPIGKHNETIPIDNVSSVGLDMTYNPQCALMALAGLAIGGFIIYIGYWIGLLSVMFGAVMILVGIETTVSIHKSGTTVKFGVPFFERGKIREMAGILSSTVRENVESRSSGADRIVEAFREYGRRD